MVFVIFPGIIVDIVKLHSSKLKAEKPSTSSGVGNLHKNGQASITLYIYQGYNAH